MNITITGGAGFIGSAIARRLLGSHYCTVVDDLSHGRKENVPTEVNCVYWKDAAAHNFEGQDVIIHAAAYADIRKNWESGERERQWAVTADLTRHVLDRAPRGVRFILLSTCAVYGGGEVTEDSPVRITSPYAAAKLTAEALVSAYTEAERVRGIVLRLPSIVGAGYRHGHLADFVGMAQEGHIHALDNGTRRKTFVHLEDLLDVVESTLLTPWRGNATLVNVAGPQTWNWVDTVDVMRAMRPGKTFRVTHEDRVAGWIGDPLDLVVKSHYPQAARRSLVGGVREALEGLGW